MSGHTTSQEPHAQETNLEAQHELNVDQLRNMNHLFEAAFASNSIECDHERHIGSAPKRKCSSESFATVFGPDPSNAVKTVTRGASDLTGILHRLSIKEEGTHDETNKKRRKTSAKEPYTKNNDHKINHETTQACIDPLLNHLTPPPSTPLSNKTSPATSPTTSSSPPEPIPAHRNPFHTSPLQQSDISLESTSSSSSYAGSYSGLDCRIDPAAHHHARLDEMRRYFARNEAWTRYQRRKYLLALADDYTNVGARWLSAYPSDLWDTKAEERAGWSRMYADEYVEEVIKVHAETGFYDKARCEELYAAAKFDVPRERAKVVGWVRARQEYLFKQVWIVGEGKWGSGSGVVDEVGPSEDVA